jgi:hypothetical protein
MALSETNRISDIMPWSPLSATASIFPALVPPAQDDVGTAWLAELGGPVPFGCDLPGAGAEDQR